MQNTATQTTEPKPGKSNDHGISHSETDKADAPGQEAGIDAASMPEASKSEAKESAEPVAVSVDAQCEEHALDTPPVYFAGAYPGAERPLPLEFAEAIRSIEDTLGRRVFLFVQKTGSTDPADSIDAELTSLLDSTLADLPKGKPIAVLIHSLGGRARCAYKIAAMLTQRCGAFSVLVPSFAKSAATLMSLAADKIILGHNGELGPLDAQVYDDDTEEWLSALDVVQSVERLHASSLGSLDSAMQFLSVRSPKKIKILLPAAMHFVAESMRPLFESIDVVLFNRMSRELKVAEDYAVRLLQGHYDETASLLIARRLVASYPDHGFIINHAEAGRIGLKVEFASDDLDCILNQAMRVLGNETAIGLVETEATNVKAHELQC